MILDLNDQKIFRKLLIALSVYTVTLDKELSKEFEVAQSTVARWRNSVANPHPRLRALIIKYLLNKVK